MRRSFDNTVAATTRSSRSLRIAWFVLAALFFVSSTNVWSRSSWCFLAGLINFELNFPVLPFYYVYPTSKPPPDSNSEMLQNLSRWEYGLLYGGTFSIPFTISLLLSVAISFLFPFLKIRARTEIQSWKIKENRDVDWRCNNQISGDRIDGFVGLFVTANDHSPPQALPTKSGNFSRQELRWE